MKRRASISLLAFLTLWAFSVRAAQRDNSVKQDNYGPESSPKRSVTISGTVGSEGKTLVSDKDNRVWKVVNPDALSRSEGRRVSVKAYVNSKSSEINVGVVRLREERTTPKLDDAAFRR
jgi:hypothetical protein